MPRRLREIKQLRFAVGALAPVVAYMDRLSEAGDGWINLVPFVDDQTDRPTALRFTTLLGGGGTGATMITWIPVRTARRGAARQTLGISHLAGRRAVAALASADLPVSPAWTIEQDHPRRGLIVHPPDDEAREALLTWALRAVAALEPSRRLTSWQADVHLPLAG